MRDIFNVFETRLIDALHLNDFFQALYRRACKDIGNIAFFCRFQNVLVSCECSLRRLKKIVHLAN